MIDARRMKGNVINSYIPLIFLLAGLLWLNLAFGWVAINIGSWKFSPAYLFFTLALITGLFNLPNRFGLKKDSPELIIFAFAISTVFNIVPGSIGGENYDFLYNASSLLSLFILFLTAFLIINTEKNRLIYCCVALFILAVLTVTGLLEKGGFLPDYLDRYDSISSTFNNPNLYAGVLILYIPMAALFSTYGRSKTGKALSLLLLLLALTNLMLTSCRSAFLGFLISAIMGIVIYFRSFSHKGYGKRWPMATAFLILTSLTVLFFLLPVTVEKFTGTSITGEPRIESFKAALEMWIETPRSILVGNGLGSFRKLLPQYSYSSYYRTDLLTSWHGVHNEFLERLVEGGILGLLSYSAFLYLILRQSLLQIKNKKLSLFQRHFSLCVLMGVSAFIIDSLFSTNMRELPVSAQFIIISASGIAGAKEAEERKNQKKNAIILFLIFLPIVLFTLSRNTIRLYTDRVLRVVQLSDDKDRKAKLLDLAHKTDPQYIVPPMVLARESLGWNDVDLFWYAAGTVEDIIPSFLDIHYLKGQAYSARENHSEAILEYKKHLQQSYFDLKGETLLLYSYLWTGETEKALNRFKIIMEKDRVFHRGQYIIRYSDLNGIRISRSDERTVIEIGENYILSKLTESASGPVLKRNSQIMSYHKMMIEIYRSSNLDQQRQEHLKLLANHQAMLQSEP